MNFHRVTKENTAAIYPVTPAQEGMLFHQVSHPGAWHYFEQTEIRIRGIFDPICCEQAWNELTKRHEMLRSAFEYQSTSKSLHIILKVSTVEFSVENISFLSIDQQKTIIDEFKIADRNRGFDLKHDSLLRFKLFQLSPDCCCLIWSHPHIILDGWSGSILQSEFFAIYQSLRSGVPTNLPPPFPLRRYWDWRERQDELKAKSYWQQELEGLDSLSTVPRTVISKPEEQYSAQSYHLQLSQEQTHALQQLAAGHHTTVNTVTQAVWAVMLRFLNNQDDVVFGTVVSGRPAELAGISHFIGMLINTVPLRVEVKGDMTFVDLIQEVHQKGTDRSEHDFLPLPEIQKLSPLKNHLFNHLFVFENYPALSNAAQSDVTAEDEFTIESAETFEQAHYHFGIVIHPGDGLTVQFHYNQNQYSSSEIERLAQRLQTLIQSVIANPQTPIRELEWLADADKTFLQSVSPPLVSTDNRQSIVDLWDEQVAKTPNHPAVVHPVTMTYQELDNRANQLASYLVHELKIQPEDCIAVVLPRDESIVVALLGILKAGGCYLPIDGIPDQRILTVLEDSQAKAVIVTKTTVEQLSSLTTVPVINIQSIQLHSASPIIHKPNPHHLAYMIYTSGSTGKPKGVLLEHGGFVEMIQHQIRIFGIQDTDRVLQFASFSFDASLSEILMALLCGASVAIAPDAARKNPDDFIQCVRQHRITVVTLSPPFLRVMNHLDLTPLRVLITAGEAATPDDACFYAKRMNYFNAYGPSECSVCTTIYPVAPTTDASKDIPIGKPLPHLQIHVLNNDGSPIPAGLPGKIYISGSGLARGYHRRPDETERAFFHHPQWGRTYRTGDIGKWLDDGSVMFLGRRDHQIKLRGFRIELEEIEHALLQIPGIKQAAVIIHQNAATQELRAFYSAAYPISKNNVRQTLLQQIPAYMIPHQLIELESMPLNQNGKIDRNALQNITHNKPENDAVLPKTKNEILLVQAIQEILHLTTCSLHESFQSLGGDSLQAVRVHAKLRRSGLDLPIGLLMEPISLQTVAAGLKQVVKNAPSKTLDKAPCSPVQRWFFQHHNTNIGQFSHCVVLHHTEPFDLQLLNNAFHHLLHTHSALRANFHLHEDEYHQKLRRNENTFSIQTVKIPQPYHEDRLQQWCDQHAVFDIQNSLLFRAFWLQWDDCDFMVMIAHHLVVDAVSWQILTEDLNTLYAQLQRGDQPSIDATTSYFEWSNAVQHYKNHSPIEKENTYWDTIHQRIQTFDSIHQSATHYGDVRYKRINMSSGELSLYGNPHHQSFLYDMSLVLSCRLLCKIAQQDEICLLLSNHGRYPLIQNVECSRTVGWFTNYYPSLLRFNSHEIAEQINTIQSITASIPNHGMEYGITHFLTKTQNSNGSRFDFLFNFIGSVQSGSSINHFQIDAGKTRSSINKFMEFPFRLCIDVLLDNEKMILELAYDDRLTISDNMITDAIPFAFNIE